MAEYAFKHPLTQEVALGSQLRERRRQVHAAVARAIEQQDAEHLDERAALLAHHWEEAGEALSAARWHRRAAQWVGRTDFAAATHHWGRVRALLRELPDDREAAALGIAACTQLLNVSWRVGTGLDEARALLEEGQTLANAIGDRRAHLNLSMVYGRARCAAGDVAAYLELAIENRRAALEIDDIRGASQCVGRTSPTRSFYAGRFPEALQIAEEGLARFPRDIPPTSGSWPQSLCCVLALARHLPQLDGSAAGGARRARPLPPPRRGGRHAGDGRLCPVLRCRSLLSRPRRGPGTRERPSARGDQPQTGRASGAGRSTQLAFGYAHLAAGRAADAIEPARAALDIHRRVEKQQAGMSATLLAEALLQAGDLSAAQSAAAEAIALCRRSLRGIYEAIAHGVMARALLRRDGAAARDAAEAALACAAALIERTGARTLAPALCEWRAELAAVLGDDVTREELLRQAQQGYEEIGAPGHAKRLAASG